MMTTATTKLTGDALLALDEEMEDAPKSELVRAAGYLRENGNPNYTEFYEAKLLAQGINIQQPVAKETDGEYYYQVLTTVTICVTVQGKPGMTKEEVLESVTREEIGDVDFDDITDAVEEELDKRKATVYNLDGEELN